MGILRSGILGHLSGKTAGVVGARWKDKSYIREYVIPSNPNTTPQQTQRNKMRDCVAFCKPLVGQVFNVYVDKWEKSMSGYNRFVSANIATFDGTPAYAGIKVVQGKLWPPYMFFAQAAPNQIVGAWDASSFGNNGAGDDKVYAVVWNQDTDMWYYAPAERSRSQATITVVVPTLGGQSYHMYAWCAKYSLTSPTLLEMVSNTVHDVLSA